MFYDDEDPEPAIDDWQLVTLDDLDEIPAIGTERKPMIRVSTPCSCVDGDTRTCFLHGEVA